MFELVAQCAARLKKGARPQQSRLGDLDGVLQIGRHPLGEGQHKVASESCRHPSEGVDAVPGTAAFLKAGDDRLRRPHACGELTLAEAGLGAQVVDELAESMRMAGSGLS